MDYKKIKEIAMINPENINKTYNKKIEKLLWEILLRGNYD